MGGSFSEDAGKRRHLETVLAKVPDMPPDPQDRLIQPAENDFRSRVKDTAWQTGLADDRHERTDSDFPVHWNGNSHCSIIGLLLVNVMVAFAVTRKRKVISLHQITDFPPRQDAQFAQTTPQCW